MPERFRWAASLALTALLLSPACAQAETEMLRPGEYITEEGWGGLTISTSGDRMTFSIEVINPNGHSCGLDGEIRSLRAHLEMEGETEVCEVRFQPKTGVVEVSSDGITCHRYFCGARADSEQIAVLADGLTIYYNLQGIAPYMMGPTEILIPRRELAPIAKPDGPFGPGAR